MVCLLLNRFTKNGPGQNLLPGSYQVFITLYILAHASISAFLTPPPPINFPVQFYNIVFISLFYIYFLLHRGKLNDLNAENARLKKEIENSSEENSSFLTYEKR